MEVFRICKEEHSKKLISSGSANRWNRKGEFVIYTGSTRSLSTLELIVHKNSIITAIPYKVLIIEVKDDKKLIREISENELPENWRSLAAYSTLQNIGSIWYNKNETLVLKVPSSVIPQEFNYIINTEHSDFKNKVSLIKIEDYFWDNRLL